MLTCFIYRSTKLNLAFRPKVRKCVKESSSSPSDIIVDDKEEAPKLQDKNVSSCSDEAEQEKECWLIDEQNNDEGEQNSEIIELRMKQNKLSMEKAELETQKIEITRQANELTRQANELKKKKLLVIAEELKLSLKISKIDDQIELMKKNIDQ